MKWTHLPGPPRWPAGLALLAAAVLALGTAAGAPAASASPGSGSSAAAASGQAGSSHGTACNKTASGRLTDCPSPLAGSELPAGARNPAIVTSPVAQSDLAALVDTRTWTSGGGNTFPGADVPFGMVQWSPDTSPNRSSGGGYTYGNTSLTGYSLTHVSGPGCGAGGDVPILPLTGALPSGNPNSVLSSFTNTGEIAQAGYYSAQSNMPNTITSQFTATPHTSMGRFTFPSTTQADFLIKLQDSQNGDFGDSAQIVGNNEVTGTDTSGNFCGESNNDGQVQRYTVHFDLVFSQPFTASQVITESGQTDPAAVFLTFNTTTDPVISAKVAISYVSTANAQLNLRTENPGWNFEAAKAAAKVSWDHLLGRIQVSGRSYAQTQEFYSLLYKDFMQPNITSDVNGQYTGADMQVHTTSGQQKNQYGIYSGWDTYHSLSQLQAMLDPSAASDQAQSLVNYYSQDQILQQWGYLNLNNYTMVGDPAQSIIADYYAFGARDFNTKQALADMLKQATTVNDVRPGEALEAKYGYLPEDGSYGCCNAHGYVPTLLEYDSADLALSQFAASQGDSKDAAMLQQRANNWENVFDPSNGLLNPRDENGRFVPNVTPTDTGTYVEGSAYEYLWDVPNDYSALFTLLGGDSKVAPALTQYWSHPNGYGMYGQISNEFGLGEQYALDYAGDPAGTQQAVNAIENTVYLPGPTGLANNDDLGAESSQFIWEMLGLYPENSGSGNLVFNSPGFPHAVISLPDGRTITINAPGASPTEFYADSLQINGQPYSKLYVPYSALSQGATLNWTLGTTPTAWGSAPQDAPPSYTSGLKPVVGALSSEQLTVAPGSSTTVQVTADNVTSKPQTAQVSLSAPAGLTVSPSSGTISLPPDGTGTLTLTVSAPASAPQSYYQVYSLPVTMTAGSGSQAYSESFGTTVLVGQQSNLKAVGYADNFSIASVSPLYQAVLQDGTTTLVPGTPIPVQANPDGIAMSPDGSTVYATCQGSNANSVVPINTATNTAGLPIPVGQVPLGIAVSPNGQDAYVADYGSHNVDVIGLSSDTVVATIPVGSEPYGVAVTPDGSTVYVSNYGDDTVTPIDTATNTAGTPIPVGSEPRSIAVSGTTAYVANQGSNTLTPINTATNTAGSPIALPGSGPYADAIDTANSTLYVTDVSSASVVPVSLSTNQPGTQIPVSAGTQGIAVSGTGDTVYVSSVGQSTITPIKASTGTPEAPVNVSSPFGIVFLPSSS